MLGRYGVPYKTSAVSGTTGSSVAANAAVLAAAYAYEQASGLRVEPDYLPAAEGLVHIESGLARWESLPEM